METKGIKGILSSILEEGRNPRVVRRGHKRGREVFLVTDLQKDRTSNINTSVSGGVGKGGSLERGGGGKGKKRGN